MSALTEVEIKAIHTRADREELRAKAFQAVRRMVESLQNVDVALSRTVPKVETSRAVLGGVVYDMHALLAMLEAARDY